MLRKFGLFAAAFALLAAPAMGQAVSTGKVTMAAPTYVTGTAGALSLDTSGNLRVTNTGTGTSNVNSYNGAPATPGDGLSNTNATVDILDNTGTGRPGLQVFPRWWNGATWDRAPGSAALGLSVNCVSGCVAGSGVSQGTATTAAPTYVNGTNNPLSLDLAGGLRASITNATLAVTQSGTWTVAATQSGTWNIGTVATITNPVAVTQSGTWNIGTVATITNPVTVVGNVASGAADSGNPVKVGGVYNSTNPTFTTGQRGDLQLGTRGSLNVTLYGQDSASTPGVSPTSGDGVPAATVGITTRGFGYTFNGTTWDRLRSGGVMGMSGVNPQATPSGGATPYQLIAANSNNSNLISTGGHTIYSYQATNNSATIAYLKFYDKATAPTCGTDTPIATEIIPGASSGGAGSNVTFGPVGLSVSLGLGICVVTGIANADNTSVAAATYAINVSYK